MNNYKYSKEQNPDAYHPKEKLMLEVFFGENAETEEGEWEKLKVLHASRQFERKMLLDGQYCGMSGMSTEDVNFHTEAMESEPYYYA